MHRTLFPDGKTPKTAISYCKNGTAGETWLQARLLFLLSMQWRGKLKKKSRTPKAASLAVTWIAVWIGSYCTAALDFQFIWMRFSGQRTAQWPQPEQCAVSIRGVRPSSTITAS